MNYTPGKCVWSEVKTQLWVKCCLGVCRCAVEAAVAAVSRRCPVPLMLRHAAHPLHAYPEGLQIAPGVYLFFEPWPTDVLPMPVLPVEQSKSIAMQAVERAVDAAGGGGGIAAGRKVASAAAAKVAEAAAQAADEAAAGAAARGGGGGPPHAAGLRAGGPGTAAPKAAAGGEGEGQRQSSGSLRAGSGYRRPPVKESTQQQRRGGYGFGETLCISRTAEDAQYFSLTLCVGKHIFSSVLGVEAAVLAFIINKWLFFVPEQVSREAAGGRGAGGGEFGKVEFPVGKTEERKGSEVKKKQRSSTGTLPFKKEEEEMNHVVQQLLKSRAEAVQNLLPISYAYTGRYSSQDIRQGGLSFNFM